MGASESPNGEQWLLPPAKHFSPNGLAWLLGWRAGYRDSPLLAPAPTGLSFSNNFSFGEQRQAGSYSHTEYGVRSALQP